MVYTIVTLNGKGFMFEADHMMEDSNTYTFVMELDVVAEFKKDAIAGYFMTRVEDDEETEE